MEKELKSCMGVLLRADLTITGHKPIQPIGRFLPKTLGWLCPVRSVLKRMPVQDFNSFSTFKAPHIKKLETYFALLNFCAFAQCAGVNFCSKIRSIFWWTIWNSVKKFTPSWPVPCCQINHHWGHAITCIRALLCK